jgi:hypothetical protein
MARIRKDDVIALIEQAFADTEYPEGAKITNCSWQNCDECAEIAREFEGRTWKTLTDVAFLRRYEAALALMTPEAFRYYLPAFMRAAVIDPKTADVILDGLEFNLSLERGASFDEEWLVQFGYTRTDYQLRRISGFTSDQKKTIRAYLEFHYHRYGEDYWEYLPEKVEQQSNTLAFWDTFEG